MLAAHLSIVLILVVLSSSKTNSTITADNTIYEAPTSTFYNKTVCLHTVYGANVTTLTLSWTLVRFQWFFETVRQFNPTLDLTRNYAANGDAEENENNATLTLKLKLAADLFQIQLVLNVENVTDPLNQDRDNDQYECQFKITARHGMKSQKALGRKSRNGSAVFFQWSFFDGKRKEVGELMDIYTRVAVVDQRGYYRINEIPTIALPTAMEQSINFFFNIRKITFKSDDQLSFSR